MADILDEIWSAFTSEHEISCEVSEKWLKIIKSTYEGRQCCDLTYLNFKLVNFQTCRASLKTPFAVFAALVFQSIDYDTKSSENAEKSIGKFRDFVKESGIDMGVALVDQVCQLIELSVSNSTEEHKTEGMYGEDDQHFFLDINFAIFASEWGEYSEFSRKTREEYDFLSDSSYKNLRLKVLQSFLLIPNIFATKEFRNQYEVNARENIKKEIDNMK